MTRVDLPMLLDPVLVAKPWGGRRLAEWGRALPPDGTWGESWDVSDLDPAATTQPDPVSRVVGGPHRDRRLQDLIQAARDDVLGDSAAVDGRFPLLVKTLDAREHLSVQVHPSDRYVIEDPTVNRKTESWVVMAAEPGAGMWLGLDPGVAPDDFRRAAGTPAMIELLRWVPAEPGAVHHLPAGLVHALGAGVMVAEVQTPSDTTFRLYDWTREYGREPRDLHLAEGLHAMELEWDCNFGVAESVPEADEATIVDTDHYRIDRHELAGGGQHDSTGGRARVLMVLDGAVAIRGAGHDPDAVARHRDLHLDAGGVVVLPAAWSGSIVAGATGAGAQDAATMLEVTAA